MYQYARFYHFPPTVVTRRMCFIAGGCGYINVPVLNIVHICTQNQSKGIAEIIGKYGGMVRNSEVTSEGES